VQHISKNFGLTGGTLNGTKHVEAALTRLLNSDEKLQYSHRYQMAAIVTQPQRVVSAFN